MKLRGDADRVMKAMDRKTYCNMPKFIIRLCPFACHYGIHYVELAANDIPLHNQLLEGSLICMYFT